MKTKHFNFTQALQLGVLFLFILSFTSINAQVIGEEDKNLDKPETAVAAEIYWHVKAYRPEADFLAIKAIDKYGRRYDVKAIQDSDDTSVLNVKALVGGERLPVKVIVKTEEEQFYPVKAIDSDGNLINIKAITKDGQVFDVKGFSRSGNIMHLRAITKDFKYYNIVAIAPNGTTNGVKGVKMMDDQVETVIKGVKVFAHIKALKQQ